MEEHNKNERDFFSQYVSLAFGKHEQHQPKIESFSLNYKRFLPINKKSKLLDVGIGRGEMLTFWKNSEFENFTGIDISKDAVEFCRRQIAPDALLVKSTEEFLRQHSEEYDLITMMDVIEHISQEQLYETISLLYSALKKEGVLILQTCNMASPSAAIARYHDITHKIGFTENSLGQLLYFGGFKEFNFFSYEEPVHSVAGHIRRILRQCYYGKVRFLRLLEHASNSRVLTPVFFVVAKK